MISRSHSLTFNETFPSMQAINLSFSNVRYDLIEKSGFNFHHNAKREVLHDNSNPTVPSAFIISERKPCKSIVLMF